MTSLAGKVALVTGAGRGLGRACAQLFAREGAKVIVAEIDPETGEETARLLREAGAEAAFVQADVSQPAEVEAMVAFARDTFGRFDCAVNNAVRFIPRQPLDEIDEDAFRATVSVNVTGVFLCMKYEIRAMLEAGGGAIVNIGSARENTGQAGLSWYLGAKQAVYGMTKCAALDYGDKGIRINAVAPGPMWTPMLRETAASRPQHLEQHIAHIPLRRIAEPEEVAEAAIWLCSPRAGFVHGVTLAADGGYIIA